MSVSDPAALGVAEAARAIAEGRLTSEDLTAALCDRIAERRAIGAWAWHDREAALEQARALDAMAPQDGRGPLHGVPLGIKDVIDTADMPTENGYAGHAGRQPDRDAACVAQLRDAGALVLGKTVTTELAVRHPGLTVNPVNPMHTPGGSSSGSAAAVRDRQVPAALGTQTAGSVIRPASYCGVVGYKPSFGLVARRGVCLMAPWLDTVGALARSVEDVALVVGEMLARDPDDPQAVARSRPPLAAAARAPASAPRLAFVRTSVWDKAAPEARAALEGFAADAGAEEVTLPRWMDDAWNTHQVLMTYGVAQHYGPLLDRHGPKVMSEVLQDVIADGRGMTEKTYRAAQAHRLKMIAGIAEALAGYDAALCLPAPGGAPEGLSWTGDPVFNAFWTTVGTPCVTLPKLECAGMPLGVQLVAPRGRDTTLLATAAYLENA